MFRQIRSFVFAAALLAIGVAAFYKIRFPGSISAQTAPPVCSATMLRGGYAYNVNGSIFTANNLAGFYAIVGVLTADGVGSFSGTDTISENGVVQAGRVFSGTFSVQPNCTGTMTLNYSGLIAPFAFAISDSGDQISFMQTNNGTVGIGIARRQVEQSTALRR